MIAVYIIAALILLILLLLFLDISLIFSYKEKFSFTVKFGIVSLSGSKIVEMIESSEKDKSKNQSLQANKKAASKKKKTPSDIIDTVTYVIDLIGAILGEFTSYARIKFARVKIAIGCEDCAETALIYGAVSSALYSVLEILDSFITVKKNYKHIGVYPDFTSDSCRADIKIILKLKILHLLLAFVHLLPKLAEAKKGK